MRAFFRNRRPSVVGARAIPQNTQNRSTKPARSTRRSRFSPCLRRESSSQRVRWMRNAVAAGIHCRRPFRRTPHRRVGGAGMGEHSFHRQPALH
jgi:hypothetical protein